MTTTQISANRWATLKDLNGCPTIFTHLNPDGNGFETYTARGYVLAHGEGLTLDGAPIRFTKPELRKLRAL